MPSVTLRPGLARITGNDGRNLLDTSQRRYARLATKQGRITVPDRTNTTVDRSVDLGAVPSGARFALVICNLYELGGARRYSYTVNINGSYLVTASHGKIWRHSHDSVQENDNYGYSREYHRHYVPHGHTRACVFQVWHFKVASGRLYFREETSCKASPEVEPIGWMWPSGTDGKDKFHTTTLVPQRVVPTIVGTDIRYTAYILG